MSSLVSASPRKNNSRQPIHGAPPMQCSARGGESSRPPGSGSLAADRPPRVPKPAPRRRGQPAKRKRANSTLGQLVSDLIRASLVPPMTTRESGRVLCAFCGEPITPACLFPGRRL